VTPHSSYCAKLLIAAAIVGAAGKLAQFNTIGCDAFDHDRGDYMAYCNTPAHGHYDHSAFAYDLEPGVRASIRAANVLVLGSSHIQVALSTDALSAFERSHPNVRPYLMGFGYVEQDKFAATVIARFKPSPRIVIVNLDPFFADAESIEAARLARNPGIERANALAKRVWHRVSDAECTAGAGSFLARRICGKASTMYRSRADGRWIFDGPRTFKDTLAAPPPLEHEAAIAADYAANAERFLKQFAIDRRCVVITHVPDGYSPESLAHSIADRVGATFIAPHLDHLGSPDGTHLDDETGERWSAAFLTALTPVLSSCLSGGGAE
jgi:hypothetical protein